MSNTFFQGGKKFCRRGSPLLFPGYRPADDQEEMNNFYQQNQLVQSHLLAMQTALLRSVKSDFTTLVSKQALHVISTPCALHRHALAS